VATRPQAKPPAAKAQPKPKDILGRTGEELAAQALTANGIEILDRNWRCKRGQHGQRGELDIVAREGASLIAVEVKTRSSIRFGTPAAGISQSKVKRMQRLFGQWLSEHKTELPPVKELRLDAVAVLLEPGTDPIIEHIRGIS